MSLSPRTLTIATLKDQWNITRLRKQNGTENAFIFTTILHLCKNRSVGRTLNFELSAVGVTGLYKQKNKRQIVT